MLNFNHLNGVLLPRNIYYMSFSNYLKTWYLQNKRDLPWRKTKDPFKIWLSEIILQQTRVDQGLAYFLRFIEAYPKVENLANAEEEEVLKIWQGLGYYSRARNLHYSAKYIMNESQGEFPSTYSEIIKLKGVGDYTASAIASICFNEPTAVVDGNVYRVLSRYFGIKTAINSTKGIKEFKALAQEVLLNDDPGTYNQAIMEYGARKCVPQNPYCETCGLKDSCYAYLKGEVKSLPYKEKKLKIRNRYFNYLVIQTKDNCTALEKRVNGIWTGLYQFPLIETKSDIEYMELIANEDFQKRFKDSDVNIKELKFSEKAHKLSHQHIYTKFWLIEIDEYSEADVAWNEVFDFPVPVLIDNFLQEHYSH